MAPGVADEDGFPEILQKITDCGMEEYAATLRAYAKEKEKNWLVVSRSPNDDPREHHIQDADLLLKFCSETKEADLLQPKYAVLLKERIRGSQMALTHMWSRHF